MQLGCVHIGFITTAAKVLGIGELVAEPRFKVGKGGASPAGRGRAARHAHPHPAVEALCRVGSRLRGGRRALRARTPDRGRASSDPQVLHNGMVTTLDDPGCRSGDADGRADPSQPDARPRARSSTGGGDGGGGAGAVVHIAAGWSRSRRDAPDPPPLAGVRILEITNLIAGPTAGRILADLGADVIKLEPPGGDMSRPIARTYFYSVNFNKRSVCVDTQKEAGKKLVQRIAATADALIANLRPHATERMGVGPAVNPRLIETHMTGYGWTGPYAKRPGIDPLAQALMGLSRAQGGAENPPVFPAQLAPTDYTNGAMGALSTCPKADIAVRVVGHNAPLLEPFDLDWGGCGQAWARSTAHRPWVSQLFVQLLQSWVRHCSRRTVW